MSIFKEWTTAFPGKCGLSWKRAWHGQGTKEEAEAEAARYGNTVAIPVCLFEKMKEHERRMVEAEGALQPVAVRVADVRNWLKTNGWLALRELPDPMASKARLTWFNPFTKEHEPLRSFTDLVYALFDSLPAVPTEVSAAEPEECMPPVEFDPPASPDIPIA